LRENATEIKTEKAEIDRLTEYCKDFLYNDELTTGQQRATDQLKAKQARLQILGEERNILLKQQSEQHQGGMFILKIYPLYKFD
jgi:hypothetical protein